MNQIIAAVCDSDEAYVSRFALYVKKHHSAQIALSAFTKPEAFLEGLRRQVFGVVLLGQGFEEAKEGLAQHNIPALLLTEEESHKQDEILKYQSAENIVHEIYRVCEEDESRKVCFDGDSGGTSDWNLSGEFGSDSGGDSSRKLAGKPPRMSRIEWIGVHSPVQHEMQMPFSVTIASLLSEQKKVLYLNFMEWPGFLEIFQLEGEKNLGDLLVKIRQNRLTAEGFYQTVYQSGTLFYIPPVTNPEYLYQAGKEEYLKLFVFLEQETDFEAVVLDIGGVIPGFFEVLDICSEVFSVMKSGAYAECRQSQFAAAVRRSGLKKLPEKIQTVYLPYSATQVIPAMGLLEQFKWSELGDMARKYLFGGAACDC